MGAVLTLYSKDYGYVIFNHNWKDDIEDQELSKATKHLLLEFEGLKKNSLSYKISMDTWKAQCLTQGIICTNQDIQTAYDLAYGNGCEWEWEYE